MSGQKYTRTNFEEDEASVAGTPTAEFPASVMYKRGAGLFRGKRTLLECILVVILGIASLAIVVLAALLAVRDKQIEKLGNKVSGVSDIGSIQTTSKSQQQAVTTTKKPDIQNIGQCLTPECIQVAASLLSAMDRTVDPCEDFYMYACGGWIKKHVIPSGHSRWSTFGELWKENQEVMKRVIETPLNSSQSDAERKAKLYYLSCMDKNKTIEDRKGKPLLEMMRNMGGWGISNKTGVWDEKNWSLQAALEKMKIFGVLFSLYVGEDDKNSSRNILQIDQGGLGLPERDYYLNKTVDEDKVLGAYLDYMTTTGVLLGGEENDTRAQMLDVIEFETQLANITVPSEDRRDEEELYHKMSVRDIQQLAPFINWVSLLNSVLKYADIQVDDTEEAVVYMPDYMKDLTKLVQTWQKKENGNRTLHNYLMWHVVKTMTPYLSDQFRDARTILTEAISAPGPVKNMTPYLSDQFRDARTILTEAISGTSGGEELWRHCISDTDEVLGFALGSMFVRETFNGESKHKAEVMIDEVKTAFKNDLPSLLWMDDETRAAAIDKANAVIDMIGFPEYILNRTRLDSEYKGLIINESEYFENNVRNLYFELKENMKQLRKPPEPNVWDMTPPTVNAYYTPTKNEIVFPAGILQAPFYSPDYPKSLNFGAMGVVMGHELTHGFDDQGREYDKMGNLRPWWNNASIGRFEEKTNCMVDQYSQYTVNGDHVRGKQTLGENIADNGGLKAAFHAYEDWVENHGEEIPLPGLNLTHRQIFFLGFSQVWCSISTPEADKLQIVSDPHSPAKYRVIGTLSNSYQFSKQYGCSSTAAMNPAKKCVIW